MSKKSILVTRLKRKWTEHRAQDPSAFSFFCYCIKYGFVKIFRLSRNAVQIFRYTPHTDPEKLSLALRITGGLGDAIIHRRIAESIAERCPNADFYVFCPVVKQGEWVFGNAPYVKAVLPLELFSYYSDGYCDAALTLNTFATFAEEFLDMERVRCLAPALLNMYASSQKKRREFEFFIEQHPILDGAFARQIVARGYNRHTFLAYMLDIAVPKFELELSMDMSAQKKIRERFPVYVTINTGFDAFFIISGSVATKCYPKEYWTKLTALLKEKYPEIGVIQVGGKNSPHISGVDLDLAGKTTLAESAGILKGSRLHFDIEGGLVHVCASIGTRCVTLFGPTSLEYFGYPQNIKLRDGSCLDCWWSTERWMECCPRKYPRPECMYKLTPEKVLAAASALLDETAAVPARQSEESQKQ